jgi:hypothetical protein
MLIGFLRGEIESSTYTDNGTLPGAYTCTPR